jgi:hypothetical protein
MNDCISGIINSPVQPADEDGKRITFLLFDENGKREISCVSNLAFDRSALLRSGDRINLRGNWETGYFRFNGALR